MFYNADPIYLTVVLFFQNILDAIEKYVYPSPALVLLHHKIGNTEYTGANMLPAYALLVELGSNGQVVSKLSYTQRQDYSPVLRELTVLYMIFFY